MDTDLSLDIDRIHWDNLGQLPSEDTDNNFICRHPLPHGPFVVLDIQAGKEAFSTELYPQTKNLFTHKVIF